jgi:hypothetical protein
VGAAEPTEPDEGSTHAAAAFPSIAVEGLSSHIASLLLSLDDEVRRLREEAEREAEQIVADARTAAERITRDADERVARAEASRVETLEQRDRIVAEVGTLREAIVDLESELRVGETNATDGPPPAALPPPPGAWVDANQSAFWTDDDDGGGIEW